MEPVSGLIPLSPQLRRYLERVHEALWLKQIEVDELQRRFEPRAPARGMNPSREPPDAVQSLHVYRRLDESLCFFRGFRYNPHYAHFDRDANGSGLLQFEDGVSLLGTHPVQDRWRLEPQQQQQQQIFQTYPANVQARIDAFFAMFQMRQAVTLFGSMAPLCCFVGQLFDLPRERLPGLRNSAPRDPDMRIPLHRFARVCLSVLSQTDQFGVINIVALLERIVPEVQGEPRFRAYLMASGSIVERVPEGPDSDAWKEQVRVDVHNHWDTLISGRGAYRVFDTLATTPAQGQDAPGAFLIDTIANQEEGGWSMACPEGHEEMLYRIGLLLESPDLSYSPWRNPRHVLGSLRRLLHAVPTTGLFVRAATTGTMQARTEEGPEAMEPSSLGGSVGRGRQQLSVPVWMRFVLLSRVYPYALLPNDEMADSEGQQSSYKPYVRDVPLTAEEVDEFEQAIIPQDDTVWDDMLRKVPTDIKRRVKQKKKKKFKALLSGSSAVMMKQKQSLRKMPPPARVGEPFLKDSKSGSRTKAPAPAEMNMSEATETHVLGAEFISDDDSEDAYDAFREEEGEEEEEPEPPMPIGINGVRGGDGGGGGRLRRPGRGRQSSDTPIRPRQRGSRGIEISRPHLRTERPQEIRRLIYGSGTLVRGADAIEARFLAVRVAIEDTYRHDPLYTTYGNVWTPVEALRNAKKWRNVIMRDREILWRLGAETLNLFYSAGNLENIWKILRETSPSTVQRLRWDRRVRKHSPVPGSMEYQALARKPLAVVPFVEQTRWQTPTRRPQRRVEAKEDDREARDDLLDKLPRIRKDVLMHVARGTAPPDKAYNQADLQIFGLGVVVSLIRDGMLSFVPPPDMWQRLHEGDPARRQPIEQQFRERIPLIWEEGEEAGGEGEATLMGVASFALLSWEWGGHPGLMRYLDWVDDLAFRLGDPQTTQDSPAGLSRRLLEANLPLRDLVSNVEAAAPTAAVTRPVLRPPTTPVYPEVPDRPLGDVGYYDDGEEEEEEEYEKPTPDVPRLPTERLKRPSTEQPPPQEEERERWLPTPLTPEQQVVPAEALRSALNLIRFAEELHGYPEGSLRSRFQDLANAYAREGAGRRPAALLTLGRLEHRIQGINDATFPGPDQSPPSTMYAGRTSETVAVMPTAQLRVTYASPGTATINTNTASMARVVVPRSPEYAKAVGRRKVPKVQQRTEEEEEEAAEDYDLFLSPEGSPRGPSSPPSVLEWMRAQDD